MSRSSWKAPYVHPSLLSKAMRSLNDPKKPVIQTWARASTILPQFVGLTFMVHNGKKYVSVLVTEEMVGHKLGEFAPTRTFKGHSGDRKVNATNAK